MAQDTNEPDTTEHGPEDLTRLVEALHPTKEEDERAERFAARLLERPAAPEAPGLSPSDQAERNKETLAAALEDAQRRSRQRDVLMAAIGFAVGVVGTLVLGALT